MTLFDVNILVYAHREDQEDHDFYREKLEAIIETGEPFGLTNAVARGFVRVVTQPKFPGGPAPCPARWRWSRS